MQKEESHESHRSHHPARNRHPALANLHTAAGSVLQASRAQRRQRPGGHALESRGHPSRRRDSLLYAGQGYSEPGHGLPRPRWRDRRPFRRLHGLRRLYLEDGGGARRGQGRRHSSHPYGFPPLRLGPADGRRGALYDQASGAGSRVRRLGQEEEAALDRRRLRLAPTTP